MLDVIFHEFADRELTDSAAFYRERDGRLGSAFIDEVERATTLLAQHPLLGAAVHGECRRWFLRGFPFGIFYRQAGNTLRILAIAHHRREPLYWLQRR